MCFTRENRRKLAFSTICRLFLDLNNFCTIFAGLLQWKLQAVFLWVRNTFWMWGYKIFVHIILWNWVFWSQRLSTAHFEDRITRWNVKHHVLRELAMLTMASGHSMVLNSYLLMELFLLLFSKWIHEHCENEIVLKYLQQNRAAPCHIHLQFLTHTSEATAWKSFDFPSNIYLHVFK